MMTLVRFLQLRHAFAPVTNGKEREDASQEERDHGHSRDTETNPGGQSDRAVPKATGVNRKTVGRYRTWVIEQGVLSRRLPP